MTWGTVVAFLAAAVGQATATDTATPTATATGPGTATGGNATVSMSAGASPLGEHLPEWALFPGWRVAVLVVTIALGAYLSTYLVRLLGRPVARRFRRQSVAQVVLGGVRGAVVLFAAALGLTLAGLKIGNIVLSVTVFSAVLGLVLAPIVGSVINGLFVLADQPYEIGDMIELDTGVRGFVDDITIRYTKLLTMENSFMVIPNATIRERDVINYSAEDERTRLQLQVLVTYESDLDAARDAFETAARTCDSVVEGGPDIRIGNARYAAGPRARIDNYADHGVLFTLVYWARQPYKPLRLRSDIQERIWELVHQPDVDVEFAYPHQHLVFDDTSGTARIDVGFSEDESARSPIPDDAGDARDGER